MLTTARPTSDPIARALAWISTRGIEVVHWRTDHFVPDHDPADHPVLYLVPAGALPPPSWGPLEDWVRFPTDSGELYDRAERLINRAAEAGSSLTEVDDDDVLRVGPKLVPLSPLESKLIRALMEQVGCIVSREEIEARLWPDGSPGDERALDNRLKRLRQRLDGLPLRIHTVRGRGFLLERLSLGETGPDGDGG